MTLRWQAVDPFAGWSLHATAAYDLRTYRFRNDDGSESAATWKDAENTPITQTTGEVFRLRIAIQETGGGGANNQTIHLQYRIDGGNWSDIGLTTPGLRLGNSPHVADLTPTTQQLSGTSGNFLPGALLTQTTETDVSFTGSDNTEVEWASLLITEDVPDGALVEFQVTINGTVSNTVSNAPSLTAAHPVYEPPTEAPVLSAGTAGGSSQQLSWTTVPNVVTYEVQRDGVTIQNNSDTSVEDTGLAYETTYTYRVRGVNNEGVGPWSNEVVITTGPAPQNPNYFTHIAIGQTPSGWSDIWEVDAVSTVETHLGAPHGDVALERTVNGTKGRRCFAWQEVGRQDDAHVIAHVKLSALGSNDARLYARAGGSAGSETGYYAEVWGGSTPRLMLRKFVDGAISSVDDTPFEAKVGVWYTIYLAVSGSEQAAMIWETGTPRPVEWMVTGADTSITSAGYIGIGETVDPGTTLYYDTIAWGPDAASLPNIAPDLGPVTEAPVLSADSVGETTVGLSWSLVSSAESYELQRNTVTIHDAYSDSIEDSGLDPETSYTYRVRGINSEGVGPWSNEVSVFTLEDTSSMPSGFIDFADDTVGAAPSGWQDLWYSNNTTEVVEEAAASGGKILRRTAGATGTKFYAYTDAGKMTDANISVRFRANATDATTAALVRADGVQDSESGYQLEILGGTDAARLTWRDGKGGFFFVPGTESVTLPFTIDADTWYMMRLEAVGSTIRGKVWPDGQQEPTEWLISGVHSSLTDGYIGVQDWSSLPVYDYDYIEYSGLIPPPIEPPTEAPSIEVDGITESTARLFWPAVARAETYYVEMWYPADNVWGEITNTAFRHAFLGGGLSPGTSYLFRVAAENVNGRGPFGEVEFATISGTLPAEGTYMFDFSDTASGVGPIGWAPLWNQSATPRVYDDPAAAGGKFLRFSLYGDGGRHILAMRQIEPALDMDVRARFRMASAMTNDFRVFARAYGDPGAERGLYGELYFNSGNAKQFRLYAYEDTGLTSHGTLDYDYKIWIWYQMRVQARGDNIRTKVWIDGEAEPAAWTHESITSTLTSPGAFGVGAWGRGFPIDVDSISVGYGTNDAPELPPRISVPDNIPSVANVNVYQSSNTIVVEWDNDPNATGYIVRRNGIDIADISDTQFVDTDVVSGNYEYEVRAYRSTV